MIHKGDKGTVLELKFSDYEEVDGKLVYVGPLPIGDAAEIIFYFRKPDGTKINKKKSLQEVVLSTDGNDGKARHIVETGFLNVAGNWEWKGWAKLASGAEHWAKTVTFTVADVDII